MAQSGLVLEPGTLWEKVKQQTEHALGCGALQTISTKSELIEQNGIPFLVRILSSLKRKEDNDKNASAKNPFLPYEEDLFVTNISDTHLCLLNKFNVAKYHLLIVTREYEEQDTWLNQRDFEAMWATLAEIDGLVFYNGGKTAGASQRHKHLQLVPFPLIPEGPKLPIEEAIASAQFKNGVGTTACFPFRHVIVPLGAAEATLERYSTLLQAVGMSITQQPKAYNLLATREWMLIVPRSQESFRSISVNSLGFAGTLLARDRQQLKLLKEAKPLTVLTQVAFPSE